MHSVWPIAVGVVMPPVESLVQARPISWQGMRIEWTSRAAAVPVFLGKLPASDAEGGRELFIFGARYKLSEALIDGQSLGPGYFVEYFVVREESVGKWVVHRLLQHQSVTFCEADEPGDYAAASLVVDRNTLCQGGPPRWKHSEAVWPTHDQKPMTFRGQLTLPDTQVARDLFTWGLNIYLFSAEPVRSIVFKIIEQETDFQTADEHYASEGGDD
jgi:hypothetical protein